LPGAGQRVQQFRVFDAGQADAAAFGTPIHQQVFTVRAGPGHAVEAVRYILQLRRVAGFKRGAGDLQEAGEGGVHRLGFAIKVQQAVMLIAWRGALVEVGQREQEDLLVVLGRHQRQAAQGVVGLPVDTDQVLHLLGAGIAGPAPFSGPDLLDPGTVQH